MTHKWILIMWMLVGAVTAMAGTRMSVQVREGEIRNRPSFLGSVVAVAQYGDRVTVEREQGPWRFVEMGDVRGWIHESSLTRQRIQWQAGEQDLRGAATEDELALAGRGFNARVEGEFKRGNEGVDFTWVDRMEAMRKSPTELLRFLQEGGLRGAEE